jgi:hypothetical protein
MWGCDSTVVPPRAAGWRFQVALYKGDKNFEELFSLKTNYQITKNE